MKLLQKLINKEDLNEPEAKELMRLIIEGKLTDAQAGGVLIALQNKGVNADELSAFVEVLKEFAVKIKLDVKPVIDTCGTGGDSSGTFNISTVTAFVLAACNVFVAKHGNNAVSSGCGSADVLEKLGININLPPENTKRCIEEIGIGFMFAPLYHPAFKNVAHIRKELGVRTVFNMLGPLLNPANVDGQIIGVFEPGLINLYIGALKRLGMKNAMVFHGDGLDEITICGETRIAQLANGKVKKFKIKPEDFGFKACSKEELKGGSLDENAKIFLEILNGGKSAKRDIVLLNAAAGLIVAGKTKTFEEGIKIAAEAIDNSNAMKKFEEFKEFTNDIAENN